MTPTRYLVARITRAFGLHRRNQRMTDAATEMHLLRDAEAYLGATVWEKIEGIEKLSTEYWNLRKLTQEREAVAAKLLRCQQELKEAHEERANLLNIASEPEVKLADERSEILDKLSVLTVRRDEVIAAAKEIRKSYDGLKVKSEVLAGGDSGIKPPPGELEKVNQALADLKAKFAALKTERLQIAAEIEKGDAEIDRISEQLRILKKAQYDRASKSFQAIGDSNKESSTYRAELGLLESRMTQLHTEIGRHLSRNTATDRDCARICKEQHRLIEVMEALRRSIAWNNKLADR